MSAAIREALEPFAKALEEASIGTPDTVSLWFHPSAMGLTVGDLRRARTAYDAIGFGVKALEWEDSGAGNHSSAHSELGLYVVSQTRSGNFRVFVLWIDPGGNDADREICEAGSLLEAKAAAQADFERRVLSYLSTHTAAGAGPVDRIDLEAMLRPLDGYDKNQPGYRHRVGWNDAILHVMDVRRATAGAGPVGEAVAWREIVSMRIKSLEDGDQFGTKRFAIAELRSILDHATRTAEEPGEVEGSR